jgi:hypothetical protein
MQPDKQEEYNKAVIKKMVEACAKFQRVFSGAEGEEVLSDKKLQQNIEQIKKMCKENKDV